ncbi:shikimate kinase [Amphibacillus sediminis]|uniref:shikimate kinase n=1 Tax=Amphibacillus sediminis TaxID=360185 RepID=UPI00082C8458|nr:shikimate kinase [Amphibacillus sediminis]
MESVYFIGFMGSGKSTIAQALAQHMQMKMLDTDNLIETVTNKTIKAIFECDGEAVFREIEHDVLIHTPANNHIIATGGGIVERSDNRIWLENKQVIYLRTHWNTIKQRLQHDQVRPIWQDKRQDKAQLLKRRDPLYLKAATHVIDTDNLDVETIVSQLSQLLNK